MVRLMERLPDGQAGSARPPRRHPDAPDRARDLRHAEGRAHSHAGLSAAGVDRQAGLGAPSRASTTPSAALGRTLPYRRAVDLDALHGMRTLQHRASAEYDGMVDRAKEYIRAGDIFQVVLSQRFEADFQLPPTALYRALRRTNPSPYMSTCDFGGFAVAGSSPEILVACATARSPSARSPAPASAARRRRTRNWPTKLLTDPKELAEHLMLLDLGRNDVGRVAEIGTVKVTDKFFLEYYSHVMHIVSNVVGDSIRPRLRRCARGRLPGRHRLRRPESPGDGDHRRAREATSAASMAAASAISAPTAPWTPASSCAPRSSRTASIYVQAGAGIVADSEPEPSSSNAKTRPAPFSAPPKKRYATPAAGEGSRRRPHALLEPPLAVTP